MNKMFKFNGMPYKRSGRAGGKSVSMIGMLVLLLAALLVLPSCFDDDEVPGPTVYVCPDGSEAAAAADCPDDPDSVSEYEPVGETDAENPYEDGDGGHMLIGGDDADYIDGQGGNDSIKGMGGNDDLTGGAGDDTLYGDDGNDKLDGGTGNDTIDGGAGDDELTGGSGNNALDGGEGDEDIAIYLGAMQATVDLRSGKARVQHETPATGSGYISLEDSADSGTGNDTLTNIENVKGTHGNDIIDGNEVANLLKGLDGADVINGHDGDDTILPNRPAMDINGDGTLQANTATGDDTANDPPTPDGIDVVDGGEGSDTISYEGESAMVTIDLSAVVQAAGTSTMETPDDDVIAHVLATVDGSVGDMIKVGNIGTEDEANVVSTIENVVGGFGEDMLTGDARANTLMGGADDDTLTGGAGDDTLMGGAGDDTLDGGADSDTLMGGAGNDTLTGGAGVDTLVGCAGENTLTGGGGDNVFGVFNGGTDDAADTITDFTTGTTATATTDEIHLKGFEAGVAVTITPILANATHAAVNVNGVPVVSVTSALLAVVDDPETDVDETKSKVQVIIDALEKNDAVQMDDEFDITKCSSS
jgi:Ca2+-binding RTX toxin-like protein